MQLRPLFLQKVQPSKDAVGGEGGRRGKGGVGWRGRGKERKGRSRVEGKGEGAGRHLSKRVG